MSRVFESFKRLATKDEIAASITHDTIDEIERLRTGREDQPHTPQEQELMTRLSVLMTGPRKEAVLPVIRQRWPQMAQLLDRKVGVVRHAGTILTPEGEHFQFDHKAFDPPFEDGAQVTFLPTDDGMARNIQVIA